MESHSLTKFLWMTINVMMRETAAAVPNLVLEHAFHECLRYSTVSTRYRNLAAVMWSFPGWLRRATGKGQRNCGGGSRKNPTDGIWSLGPSIPQFPGVKGEFFRQIQYCLTALPMILLFESEEVGIGQGDAVRLWHGLILTLQR